MYCFFFVSHSLLFFFSFQSPFAVNVFGRILRTMEFSIPPISGTSTSRIRRDFPLNCSPARESYPRVSERLLLSRFHLAPCTISWKILTFKNEIKLLRYSLHRHWQYDSATTIRYYPLCTNSLSEGRRSIGVQVCSFSSCFRIKGGVT